MAERLQIVRSQIPAGAITAFRRLSRSDVLERLTAPKFAAAFEEWLITVARTAAADFPARSGRGRQALMASARVRGGRTYDSIRGYFLVPSNVAVPEYGATVRPKKATKLAIPLPAALHPDGSPKRRGPLSWKPLGTFVYKSGKTGRSYIAYKNRKGLVLLYLLVDKAEIPGGRYIRSAFDRMLPQLYAKFYTILTEQINLVYTANLEISLKGGKVYVGEGGTRPRASNWARPLTPNRIGK
jgi:hypothetical protein